MKLIALSVTVLLTLFIIFLAVIILAKTYKNVEYNKIDKISTTIFLAFTFSVIIAVLWDQYLTT